MIATSLARNRCSGFSKLAAIIAICLISIGATSAADDRNSFVVLCYHSIPERHQGDPMSISTTRFVEQLEWLKEQGYTAISLDQVLHAKAGKSQLPSKSFLITVDDGYEDVYTNLFPLLKLYKAPAVIALVGKWIEDRQPSKNETDSHFIKQRFLSWTQIQEMTKSGLVEVASHSYDLHQGILGNPQGNVQPAAVTLQLKTPENKYEVLDQRRKRIRADLEMNSRTIGQHLGKRPRAMVWPYGAYDQIAIEEAAQAGMFINLTLDAGQASASHTEIMPRLLINKEMPLSTFSYLVQHAAMQHDTGPVHAIKVNLDRIYDKDPEKENQNLGRLIDGIRVLGLNAVVLQPFVTPKNRAGIEAVYFPNTILPMRADLLNRVAWQLRSRLGVAIYIQAPVSNLSVSDNGSQRLLDLSIARDRQRLLKLYEELGNHLTIRGILFLDLPSLPTVTSIRQDLTKQIRDYRSIPQPVQVSSAFYSIIDSKYGLTIQASGQGQAFSVIDLPADLYSPEIRRFLEGIPNPRNSWVSLPATNLNHQRLQSLLHAIRLLQNKGIRNFLLDDDKFLDEPATVDSLRSLISLKRNPYLEVGQ